MPRFKLIVKPNGDKYIEDEYKQFKKIDTMEYGVVVLNELDKEKSFWRNGGLKWGK